MDRGFDIGEEQGREAGLAEGWELGYGTVAEQGARGLDLSSYPKLLPCTEFGRAPSWVPSWGHWPGQCRHGMRLDY